MPSYLGLAVPKPRKLPARPVPIVRRPGPVAGYTAPVPANVPVSDPETGTLYGQPNYQALIENDPQYQLLKAQLEAQGVQDAASRDAAIKRAYIQFGGHPDLSAFGFTDPNGGSSLIDPLTQSLADQATTGGVSTTARLGQQHDTAVAQIRNALAARGIAHSGESGFQAQREQGAYTTAQYDATQKLLDYFNGVQAAYAANQNARQNQLLTGLGEASQRQASYPWNTPVEHPAPTVQAPVNLPPTVPLADPWHGYATVRRGKRRLPAGIMRV